MPLDDSKRSPYRLTIEATGHVDGTPLRIRKEINLEQWRVSAHRAVVVERIIDQLLADVGWREA